MAKILIVEDDQVLVANLGKVLESSGFTVETASSGRDALQMITLFAFDLIVLDIKLPELDGLSICQRYRKNGGTAPILMLTGKTTMDDKDSGFAVGADDYLTKPFDNRELLMRVKALLRRGSTISQDVLQAGSITLDTNTCRVTVDGALLKLRPKEYFLLEFFLRHPKQVFSVDSLKEKLWASDSDITSDSIRVWIHRLRKRLPRGPQVPRISNIAGHGYQLEIP
jgi:DNA-binding response OmpR family regulator